ncbi:hypothetical protein LCGC14_1861060 [marine sediment metagenome]|uniref:Uncharacterized protein n=1 Tax=marine sediment metagenome TaxID=412755 RepID=A0A0F9G7K2_9ZZZZ
MSVDVNNTFNSAEDRVQYALGSMDAYSINMEYSDGSGASCVPGIVALNHTEALIKYLKHLPPTSQDYTLKVNLCE